MTGSEVSSRARMYKRTFSFSFQLAFLSLLFFLSILPFLSSFSLSLSLSPFSLPSFLPFLSNILFPFSPFAHRLRARSSRRHSLARFRSFQETLFSHLGEREEVEVATWQQKAEEGRKSTRDSFSHYSRRAFLVFRALDFNEISKQRFCMRILERVRQFLRITKSVLKVYLVLLTRSQFAER